MKTGMDEAEKQLKEAETGFKAVGVELKKTEEELRQAATGFSPPHMGTSISAPVPDDTLDTQPATSLADSRLRRSAPRPICLVAGRGSQTSTEDSEDPSPQLELGLDPKAVGLSHRKRDDPFLNPRTPRSPVARLMLFAP